MANYSELKVFLRQNLKVVANCYAVNNICLEKVKQLDVLPVSDEVYSSYQQKINNILCNVQDTCNSLENINAITKCDYSLQSALDKTRIQTTTQEVVRQCNNFYNFTNEFMKDGYIFDRQLDDLEQLHFLLSKFTLLIAENYKICISQINEVINDNADDNQK